MHHSVQTIPNFTKTIVQLETTQEMHILTEPSLTVQIFWGMTPYLVE
jgi:hypothetical protein